jgi:hypothetical protein
MNAIRSVRSAVLSLVVAAVGVVWMAAPVSARAAGYGAIAYSPSTGAYGYAYGKSCQAEAENTALCYCKAPDAQIVVWCQNACAALAVGDNGVYGYAVADSRKEAERLALRQCRDAGGCNPHIRCWVSCPQ